MDPKRMFPICRALGALAVTVTIFLAIPNSHAQVAQSLPELDQGWSNEQQRAWWGATQGSRLIPLDWFNALEVAGKKERFGSIAVMGRFGYLAPPGALPNSLPIGFAVDQQPDDQFQRTKLRWKPNQGNKEKWLGFNCSACHTSSFSRNGKTYLIEGAGGTSEFQRFIATLNQSLADTRSNKEKWDAFAERILGKSKSNKDVEQLADAYDRLLNWQTKEWDINDTPVKYGPGRIDAFGHIYNKVALTLDPARATRNPADAPVSIPFIWRAPQLDRVQYNGIAPKVPIGSFDAGAVGRNAGEVVGVFGDVVPNSNPGVFNGFASSVRLNQIVGLEDVLAKLRPPRWPASLLGDIDDKKAGAGKALYESRCASCHELVDRTDLKTRLTVQMNLLDGTGKHTTTKKPLPAPGTDPWMACNAYAYSSSAGILGGYSGKLTNNEALSETGQEGLGLLLRVTVGAMILDKKKDLALALVRKNVGREALPDVEESAPEIPEGPPGRSPAKQRQLGKCMTSTDPNLGYTSRPLNGIWATAPYLHNGSVPNMFELLLPPAKRSPRFHVGAREYDPEKMGFSTDKTAPGNTFEFVAIEGGLLVDANSNLGHDYDNASLNDDQRYQLIEYLKKL